MGVTYTYTLTNGQTADADQVMQNFNDAKAVIDVNANAVSGLLGYTTIFKASKTMKASSITGSGKVILGAPFSGPQTSSPYFIGDDSAWENAVYYVSTPNTVTGKTAQYRITATVSVGNNAPGVNFTFALERMVTISGTTYLMSTLSSNLAGPTISAPSAASTAVGIGTAAALGVSSGPHVLTCAPSGAFASNSIVLATAKLELVYV